MQLMDGKVPYTDERVKEVFAKWKELVDGKFYLPNAGLTLGAVK